MIAGQADIRRVRLVAVGVSGQEVTWTLTWADWLPTVEDLATTVGLSVGGLWINGEFCLPAEPLDAIDLFDGALVSDAPVPRPSAAPVTAAGLVQLDHIGGFGAGARIELPPGSIMATRATSNAESSHSTVASMEHAPASADHHIFLRTDSQTGSIHEEGATIWGPGTVAALGGDVFEVRATHPRTGRSECGATRRSSHVVHRQPRLLARQVVRQVPPLDLPKQPAPPQPFSWLLLLAPLPIGVLIAIIFRPYFLLFTMMGPLMAVARWIEGRRRFLHALREWTAECDQLESRFEAQVAHVSERESLCRRSRHPTLVDLACRVTAGASVLWERRPAHKDFMHLCVGYGDVAWWASPPAAADVGAGSGSGTEVILPLVPLVIEVTAGTAIGIVGGHRAAQAVARGIILQATALHGPADLAVVVQGQGGDGAEWDWCEWLPHSSGGASGGGPGSGVTASAATRSAVTTSGVPLCLVVEPSSDGPAASVKGSSSVQGSGASRDEARLVLADTIAELPATCSTVVVCGETDVEVLDVATGTRMAGVAPVGCSQRFATRIARSMARLRDPEGAALWRDSDKDVALVDMIDTTACARRWSEPVTAGELKAVVGHEVDQAGQAPVTLDLVTDGPHALIAGTTGSGKSELLRTLVVSLASRHRPTDCSFVLIDFKGGGAFDVLSGLPHVASVVTDLDSGIAKRALKSLRSELRDREELLRTAGATDLSEYQRLGGTDLGRLVLVVDEFATLAADLPEFLTGLIDIAQRGRSLGVHLVLATQRPAGVLDNKIRANTNLRVCLRVQDQAESRDVVGTVDAAGISTSDVGRAVLRVGAEPARTIQCAHIGLGSPRPASGVLSATRSTRSDPFAEVEGDVDVGRADFGQAMAGRMEGPETLVEQICREANDADLAAARPPWLASLVPEPDVAEFWANDWLDPTSLPLGRCDIPELRTQPVWAWGWSAGPIAIIGGTATDRESVSNLVAAAPSWCASIATTDERAECYVIAPDSATTQSAGSTVGLDDVEGISRVLDRCAAAGPGVARGSGTDERSLKGPSPSVVVVINGYDRVAAGADPKVRAALVARIDDLLADQSGRIAIAVLTATERGIPLRVLSLISDRIILPLADSAAYATFGLRSRDLPQLGELCGVDPTTGHLVQLCRAPAGPDASATFDLITRCPEVVCASDLGLEGRQHAGVRSIPVGLDLSNLEPAYLDLVGAIGIIGGPGSGRSNCLHVIAANARQVDPSLRITVVVDDGRRVGRTGPTPSLSQRADGSITDVIVCALGHRDSPNNIRALIAEGFDGIDAGRYTGWLVLIDDAADVSPDLGQALVGAAGEGWGLAVVVTGCPQDFRSVRSWCHALREESVGLVLSGDRHDADVLRQPLLGYPGIPWRPGDGTMVTRARSTAVRCAVDVGQLGPTTHAASLGRTGSGT